MQEQKVVKDESLGRHSLRGVEVYDLKREIEEGREMAVEKVGEASVRKADKVSS